MTLGAREPKAPSPRPSPACGMAPPLFQRGGEKVACPWACPGLASGLRVCQPPFNHLPQRFGIGVLHAFDGCHDVGAGLIRVFVLQERAVINGCVAVVHGDQIDKEACNTSIQFEEGVKSYQFTLVVGQSLGESVRIFAVNLFEKMLLFQCAEQALGGTPGLDALPDKIGCYL